MEIQVGKYLTRGGLTAHVEELSHQDRHGLIAHGRIEGSAMVCGWFKDGGWLQEGKTHERDLVERLPDEVKPKIPGKDFIEKDKNIHDYDAPRTHEYRQQFALEAADKAERNTIALEVCKHILLRGDVIDMEQVVTISFGIAELMVMKGKM